MNREIKKGVQEIIDALYDRAGFDDWWDIIGEELEEEIIEELEEIIKRRFEKNE
jgi:MoxR-like ATPase